MRLQWQSPLDISRTHNVLWNGVSRLLQVGLQFLFVPIHIHLLGPSLYGLVVLSATLMAVFAFLDHVASSVVTREFGMRNGNPEQSADLWAVFYMLERIFLGVAFLIAVVTPFLAFFLTRHWTSIDGLKPGTFWTALMLIGGALAAQALGALYASALMGLQRQKLLSIVRIFWTPLYYGGGVGLLVFMERSVIALFAWQIVAFAGLAIISRVLLHKTMPRDSEGAVTNPGVTTGLWRFGAASLLMAVSGAFVVQIDKFLVAIVTQPAEFAAYGLAFSIAMQAMTLVSSPFANAMYPHFVQMLTDGKEPELREAYHRWTQTVVALSTLLGCGLFMLGPWLIDIWLGAGSTLAPDVKRLLPLFLAAWVLNGAVTAPVMLILASGRLQLIYSLNIAIVAVAALFLSAVLGRWGLAGGAFYWFAVNVAYCFIMVPLMHQSTLKGSLGRWLFRDVGLPVFAAAGLLHAAMAFRPADASILQSGIHAIITMSLCLALLLVILPDGRRQLVQSVRFLRG